MKNEFSKDILSLNIIGSLSIVIEYSLLFDVIVIIIINNYYYGIKLDTNFYHKSARNELNVETKTFLTLQNTPTVRCILLLLLLLLLPLF